MRFESISWKLEPLITLWKQGRSMELSDSIWNDGLEVKTAEKKMKSRTINGAFWRNLKRWFGSLEVLREIWKQDA